MKSILREASSTLNVFGAFTLIELLVVAAVIGVLTATIVPALSKAKQRSLETGCIANLKQIGIAMQLYVNDNDDALPGPVLSGVRPSYDRNSSTELIWFIADYLDSQSPLTIPVNKPVIADVLICPAYLHSVPPMASLANRKCYQLNDNVGSDSNSGRRVPPFGSPAVGDHPSPLIAPLRMFQLESYSSPDSTFAMTDLDKVNMMNRKISWWVDLPHKPVHGSVRNELYFDWHVAAKPVAAQ